MSGISAGTVVISYTKVNGCGANAATSTITVSTLPSVAAIAGPTRHCVGSTITLNDVTAGGAWFSVDTSIATVNSSGVVTGVRAGITTIVYSVTNLCGTSIATLTDTVNTGTVPAITGASAVCVGSTTTLSNASAGGTWSSSNFTIASINPATGVARGMATGTVTITYSVTNACGTNVNTTSLTVESPYVAAIQGPADVCVGSTITLTDSTTGGNWSSSNPSIASVDAATGVVTGVALDSAVIVYTISNSCGTFIKFFTVHVHPLAVAGTITGPSSVCATNTITLSNTATGGTWSSS
ncbi:MAG: hypothetical protein EBZ77_11550, partial [Chitinophagia bacterium]|nr:hypothetical protein [Chitinophagia bacterium]